MKELLITRFVLRKIRVTAILKFVVIPLVAGGQYCIEGEGDLLNTVCQCHSSPLLDTKIHKSNTKGQKQMDYLCIFERDLERNLLFIA